ncbi:uncharacterized protein BT62DRAFT_934341 [Guyanagaster necrorhizus]|uniref:AAA-ATPase-like domain-containing protein n=1 Tax=Guyanagaster necrorhizus TaxID=856835 RepID=A0A9P7VMY8_9AGAR|nr:uncharacterized protein BT62DRAFT_934341 [Guyanagaster necrorhizus MCA 3950]KAG7444166.1 hypothetical protein BT62DRAFT_934341 [Guyanagaster necrorhizus MCA 3950]
MLYIVHIEQTCPAAAMFYRPKHFGKSLFIDMLKCYHGVAFADSHEKTFEDCASGTKIFRRRFALRFNLSPFTDDSVVQSFYDDLLVGLRQFWWLHPSS